MPQVRVVLTPPLADGRLICACGAIKDLDPVVVLVRDEDAVGRHRNTVREIKMSVVGARLARHADGRLVSGCGRIGDIENLDAVIAGICDPQAGAADGDVLRVAEVGIVRALDAGLSDRGQVAAVAPEDLDPVVPAIADVDIAGAVERDAVRSMETVVALPRVVAPAEFAQVLPGGVEFQHVIGVVVHQPDVSRAIDADVRDELQDLGPSHSGTPTCRSGSRTCRRSLYLTARRPSESAIQTLLPSVVRP